MRLTLLGIVLMAAVAAYAAGDSTSSLQHQPRYGYIVDAWTRCDADGDGTVDAIGENCAIQYPDTSAQWVTNSGPCVWDTDDLWNDTPDEICLNVDHTIHLLSLVVCGRRNDEWSGQISFSNLPYVVKTGERYRAVKNYECARACAIPIAYANGQGQPEGWTAIPSDTTDKFGYGIPTTVRFETFGPARTTGYSEVIFADLQRCGGREFIDFEHERLLPFTDLYWSNDPEVR